MFCISVLHCCLVFEAREYHQPFHGKRCEPLLIAGDCSLSPRFHVVDSIPHVLADDLGLHSVYVPNSIAIALSSITNQLSRHIQPHKQSQFQQ